MRYALPSLVICSLFACFGCGQKDADAQDGGASLLAKADANDWPGWRGPNRNGVASGAGRVPVSWSESENVAWKAAVPGRGHSSPTVVGKQVFLATADVKQQVQSVLAFNRSTGKQLWKTDLHQGGLPRRIHAKNTHGTCTVACDGERLFAAFYNNGAIHVSSLDLGGKQLWQKRIGDFAPRQYQYGYAASPTIYGETVIVAADYDGGGYLMALDRKTGEQVWRTDRPAKLSYSSPVVAHVAGRDQLLISGCDMVAAYNPKTGKELWSTAATTMATCGSMIWAGDLVFASGGYPKAETVCIRADGSAKIVWKNRQKCYEQSMLVHKGYLYAVTDRGIAYCWRASDGKEMWAERLGGKISASPVLVGDNIYQANESGMMFVFKANSQSCEVVAKNQLGNEGFATASICGGQIFLRTAHQQSGRRQETLYCIQSK